MRVVANAALYSLLVYFHCTPLIFFILLQQHICYYVFIDSLQSVLNLDVPGQATTLKLVLIHQLVAVI